MPQGQIEMLEGHCIKKGKLFHLEKNCFNSYY